MTRGSLPELPAAVDFGTGEAEHSFALYRKLRPEGPYFCAEYWAGWFDHWGAKHEHTDAAKQVAEIRWMLQQGYSVSMYMLFGGTSFGWFSGANSNGHNYQPDVTSYDYDAPIDEAGQPRPKFFEIRKVIQEVTGRYTAARAAAADSRLAAADSARPRAYRCGTRCPRRSHLSSRSPWKTCTRTSAMCSTAPRCTVRHRAIWCSINCTPMRGSISTANSPACSIAGSARCPCRSSPLRARSSASTSWSRTPAA